MLRNTCLWLCTAGCLLGTVTASGQDRSVVPPTPERITELLATDPEPFVVPRDSFATEPVPFWELQELAVTHQRPAGWATPAMHLPGVGLRGHDHLGEMLGLDSSPNAPWITGPIYGTHAVLDEAALSLRDVVSDLPAAPPWWQETRCRWQTRTVNWRYNSMYLQGCVPEGYDLRSFIEGVPSVVLHEGPSEVGLPLEPGGSPAEAERVDGPESRSVGQISLDIKPSSGALPEDRAAVAFAQVGERTHPPGTARNFNSQTKYWQASLLNHQPLYFEDVNLERHGFSSGVLQPAVSGIKFFATLPALPYLMTAQPPHTTRYLLGESKPGSHAPYVHAFPPLNANAAVVEAATATGLVFIIP